MNRSNSNASNASSAAGDDDGIDNPTYFAPASDHRLPRITEGEVVSHSVPPRATSASSTSFPVIYEVNADEDDPGKSAITFAPRQSASSSSVTQQMQQQQRRKSSTLGPNERHLSILDPMSDRVSTILVWQNLSVQARESRYTEFRKKITSYKNYVPKRKYLLHNTTGGITGGLWAVMGQFSPSRFSLETYISDLSFSQDHPVQENRLF